MFDQTFVNHAWQTRKPATLAVSLLLQAGVLCIVLSLPLVYTQRLPIAQLRDLFVAPAPPRAPAAHQPMARTQTRPAVRAFAPQLVAPRRVPIGIHAMQDVPAAPEIGVATGAQATPGAILDGLIPAVPQAPPPPPAAKPKSSGPVRVGGRVASANLI